MAVALGHDDRAARLAAGGALLRVNNIEVIYDHVILVLKGVSLEVREGGIVALLGANGAGKTTTLKAISNLLRAERGDVTKGTIEYQGRRVEHLSPNELVKSGVIQVMEAAIASAISPSTRTSSPAPSRARHWAAGAPRSGAISTSSTAISPACSSAGRASPVMSRAASSRWSPSAGR